MAKGKIPILSGTLHAIKQTWLARRILVNPILSFLFFLRPSILGKSFICKFHLEGLFINTRSIDWFGVDEVILNGEYDSVLATLKGMESPIVVDLGANIGTFSIKVFYFNRSAQVYSVEPSLSTWQVLEKNRLANPALRWNVFRYAVWNQTGEVGFEENPNASTGSFLNQSKEENIVPSIRLEEFVRAHVGRSINILKMDIEGAEEDVLFDSRELLDRVDVLIVEIHPNRCDEKKIRALLGEKYSYVYEATGRHSSKPLLVYSKVDIGMSGKR